MTKVEIRAILENEFYRPGTTKEQMFDNMVEALSANPLREEAICGDMTIKICKALYGSYLGTPACELEIIRKIAGLIESGEIFRKDKP